MELSAHKLKQNLCLRPEFVQLSSLPIGNLPNSFDHALCQGDSLKNLITSVQDYRSLQGFPTEQKISFHTFALTSQKEINIVISGILFHNSPDYIRQELVALSYAPTVMSVMNVGRATTVSLSTVSL